MKTQEHPGPDRPYEQVFARLIRDCQVLKGLPYAKVKEIAKGLPIDYLDELGSQVNLPPIGQGRTIVKRAPEGGMLRGADEMIDQSLSLRDVKYQSKTAALRCTKHRAIGMPVF